MNILCRLGFHKAQKDRYFRVKKRNGKNRWHTNYLVCSRCGKFVRTVSVDKEKR